MASEAPVGLLMFLLLCFAFALLLALRKLSNVEHARKVLKPSAKNNNLNPTNSLNAQKPAVTRPGGLSQNKESKEKKIGEILLEHNFIVRNILDRALEYQQKYGGNITQYLIAYGYIDESQLAQCLCSQFGVPYLQLSFCDISQEVIKMIPADIAEKYLLVPVDKVDDSIMVVMADPLDERALKAVQESSGCYVKPFVGLLSEITSALETYYHINLGPRPSNSRFPFYIDNNNYSGMERRAAIRFNTQVKVSFPLHGYYKRAETKNISRTGLCFELGAPPAMGTMMPLEIDIPTESNPLPILALGQVMRLTPLKNNMFEVGIKFVKVVKQELAQLIEYAISHEQKAEEKPEQKP